MSSRESTHEPRTPSLREKIATRLEDDCESDVGGRFGDGRTPSTPLHSTFDHLEKRWSTQKSSTHDDIFTPSIQSRPKSRLSEPRTRISTRQNSRSVQIIGSPDLIFPTTPKEPQSTSVQSKHDSVFDRLYQQGKHKVAAAKRRELDESIPLRSQSLRSPSASSVGGTTVSTLSSTESVFDRLHKHDKRKIFIGKKSRNETFLWNKHHSDTDDYSAAAASLERRLSYAPPSTGNKNRIKVTTPRTPMTTDERSISTKSTGPSSVFDRLYKREKRATSTLFENSNGSKSRTQIPTTKRRSSQFNRGPMSATPIIRGGRRSEIIDLDEGSVLESIGDFSPRGHDDNASLLVDTSAFYEGDSIIISRLGDEFAKEFHLEPGKHRIHADDSGDRLDADLSPASPRPSELDMTSNGKEGVTPKFALKNGKDLLDVVVLVDLPWIKNDAKRSKAAISIQNIWTVWRHF